MTPGTAAWSIRLIFALQSLAFGSWLPRIPEMKDALNASPADLALALLGLPAGILLMPLAPRIVAALSPGGVLIFVFPPYLLALTLPPLAPGIPAFFAALVLFGALMSLVEMAQNLVADLIEKDRGLLIMASCHGFWSLGTMSGSLVAAGFVSAGLALSVSQGLVVALALPVELALALPLARSLAAVPRKRRPCGRQGFLPSPGLMGVGLFLFGLAMAEGAAMDWVALYLRDDLGMGPAAAGLGFTVFAGSVMALRLIGDRLRLHYGAGSLAAGSALAAAVSLVALVTATSPVIAYLATAGLGIGAALAFPLAVSAASDLPGRDTAGNVAVVTFLALLGFLLGPPMIGFVAETHGLRWGLATVLGPILLSLVFARSMRGA